MYGPCRDGPLPVFWRIFRRIRYCANRLQSGVAQHQPQQRQTLQQRQLLQQFRFLKQRQLLQKLPRPHWQPPKKP
jgi:hypothetical protein